MSRIVTIAAAQLGPIARNENRASVLRRLIALMRQAKSMGAEGVTIEKPADLGPQLEAAIASGRPTVLDVRIDREIRPLATGSWDLPPIPHPMPNFGWGEDE